jgi:hypothetical protein
LKVIQSLLASSFKQNLSVQRETVALGRTTVTHVLAHVHHVFLPGYHLDHAIACLEAPFLAASSPPFFDEPSHRLDL